MNQENIPDPILTFLGHGNLNAPLWFLGMEEGAHEQYCSLADSIEIRTQHFAASMGLQESHRLLRYPISDRKNLTSVWWFMAKTARGIVERADDWA